MAKEDFEALPPDMVEVWIHCATGEPHIMACFGLFTPRDLDSIEDVLIEEFSDGKALGVYLVRPVMRDGEWFIDGYNRVGDEDNALHSGEALSTELDGYYNRSVESAPAPRSLGERMTAAIDEVAISDDDDDEPAPVYGPPCSIHGCPSEPLAYGCRQCVEQACRDLGYVHAVAFARGVRSNVWKHRP